MSFPEIAFWWATLRHEGNPIPASILQAEYSELQEKAGTDIVLKCITSYNSQTSHMCVANEMHPALT